MTFDTGPAVEAEPPSEAEKLEQGCRRGAGWFYLIAGLSIVNSAIHLFGSELTFVVGLGITQVFDALAGAAKKGTGGAAMVVLGIALVLDLAVAGLFVLLGLRAARQQTWAFMSGMIVYALDGLLILLLGGFMSAAFHVFALYFIWAGFSCLKKLNALLVQEGVRPITP